MPQTTVKAFRSLSELAGLRTAIDALNLQSRRPCAFATCSYVETHLTYDELGVDERELLFLAVFEAGRLLGYLPLRKQRMRTLGVLPWIRIGALCAHDSDRPHVVARAEDEARCAKAIYQHLLQHEPGWSLLELSAQDADSALLQVPDLSPLKYWSRCVDDRPVARVPVATWRSVPEYLAALGADHRKDLTRSLRTTLKAGRVESVSSADPTAVLPLLELYLDLEGRSWKAAARVGIGRHANRVKFFRALGGKRQPMQLAVHLLLLNDLPVAGAITGAFAGVLHQLQTCFDRDYSALGCGEVSTLLPHHYAFATGARELNSSGSDGSVAPPASAVQIFRVGSVPWLEAQAGVLERRLWPTPAKPPERRSQPTPERWPEHTEERAHAQATLATLEVNGARLERLSGKPLEQAFLTGKPPRRDRAISERALQSLTG